MNMFNGAMLALARQVVCLNPHRKGHYVSTVGAQRRWKSSSVFFSDERRTAEENVFFKKEDEVLLKTLLSNNPQLKYSSDELEMQMGPLAKDFQLACKKHGINTVTLGFINDIQKVLQMHGWKPPTNPIQ